MIGPKRFARTVETHYAPERADRRPYARLRVWGSDKTSRMLRADLVPLSWVRDGPGPLVLTHGKHDR